MLCDHLWATVLSQYAWLTWVGRLAYPIFAFLLVEGYIHTCNLKKYLGRLLFWAIVSEIPFNLMYGGGLVYRNRRPLAERVKISHQRKLKNKSEPSMTTWAALLYSVAVFKTPVRVRTGVTTLDRH